MNKYDDDKNKQQFDKWFKDHYRYDYKDLVIPESVNPQKEAWEAACEFKQKEIDKLREHLLIARDLIRAIRPNDGLKK